MGEYNQKIDGDGEREGEGERVLEKESKEVSKEIEEKQGEGGTDRERGR
jgi:hypothetical protein